MVNQFRQLYVVKGLDNNDVFSVIKVKNATIFNTLKTAEKLWVYAKFAKDTSTTGSTGADPYNDGSHYILDNNKMTLIANGATSPVYNSGTDYYKTSTADSGFVMAYVKVASGDSYSNSTTYYTQESSQTNEVGEINFKVNAVDSVNKRIYFTYSGLGKDKNGNPTVSRSPLIDPKNIVNIKAIKPEELNKNKLIQTTTVGFVVDNGTLPNQVVLGINFTNFANGDSSIYPFTVSANKGVDLAGTVANLVAAINNGKIVDLSGNQLVTASAGDSNTLVITANACGSYELGMQDVYYPKFTITEKMDDNILTPQETTFAVDTTSANGDIAAEMELLFMGERMQSGLPFNYPFHVNSKTMVNPSKNYSCLDIHYYIDNDKDFSQRSHGTVTLLFEESAINDFTVINAVLGEASSSAVEGTLNNAIYNSGEKISYIANLS